ncbi:adenylosuccinate lyase [Halobacteriovorax marinus SJ]|uniref:Adenylosuccinate lyase n=1 Tax=Halobacteriovorax marinus (strain ATCC BAA-682 / DSM 15412 / SJ) TaxID=862908 RepID=E1X5K8_HALMS|nr:adenylosuccinate lyase [Halobacteriovorax marinus]CBW27329.1 adenylosuccinate lyase [Halobacteriovorax marinus SJ]
MISRYDKKEISEIWTEENKFKTYLEVELAILKSLEGNRVPVGTSEEIRKLAKIDVNRITEIEKETRHDIIAFCSSITENLDPKIGKFFHFGVTSSDIIDSALTLQIKQSLERILPSFKKLLASLSSKAKETKDLPTIGRSHGMYAEPMSFGQKILGHYAEFSRRYLELLDYYNDELRVQFSGAVGNYTILTPELEEVAANALGLKPEEHSTQVIPRDRIAKLISIFSLTASAIERISVEIRHLHRSDVAELFEGFAKGQKGSSTMPHKKNPISGENLTGMARMLRSHMSVALDNIVLWHERDISHSSTERMYLPDAFGILLYSLDRLSSTVENLVINDDVISNRVFENCTYLSSYYLHHLIEKTNFKRDDLYSLVQQASFEASKTQSAEVFHQALQTLLESKQTKLELPIPTRDEIKNIFLKSTDKVFERVEKSYPHGKEL